VPSLLLRDVSILHVGPVDFEVPAGECAVVFGASGSGKSLLLRAIADLSPHDGQVRLDDIEQQSVSGPQWRKRVGYLPAESGWWGPLVSDHFPSDRDVVSEDVVSEDVAFEAVGLSPDAMGWEIARLSTGERQRLSLLRLLAGQPDALLLDEPTANLDHEGTRQVESLVERYRVEHGAPVLWVAHDPAQAKRLSSLHFRIEAGRVEAVAS
jgi:putative ABC transport system ATP-binding protein